MPANKIYAESLRAKLKLKSFEAKNLFEQKHGKARDYLIRKGLDLSKVREHSAKVLSTGAIAGALLMNPQMGETKYFPTPQEVIERVRNSEKDGVKMSGNLADSVMKGLVINEVLKNDLPKDVRPLTHDEEKRLEQIFQHVLGVNAKANLEGEHLNTTYGYIGAEQHLRRFPGDSIGLHGDGGQIRKEGMAPGLGAWGYFANSKSEMTPDLEEKEKWYAVVQTLYLEDWSKRQPYLKQWYKYRKVLIVNTLNGNAVVADIADSGPAAWTGKHYGGSPEVMNHLGGLRYKKGPVIVFFVDDPDNKVPLGPVRY